MKNIFLLPTDKPTSLYAKNAKLKLSSSTISMDWYISSAGYKPHHLYITSDEEINKDTKICWCIDTSNNELVLHQGVLPNYHYKHYKKIIMSTDKSIDVLCGCGKDCGTKESEVQPIDDEFLEWFVKNPSCEFVYTGFISHSGIRQYKIIIPQESQMTECYFTPDLKTTSKTICSNFGQEKMLHTIGEGIKASSTIIIGQEKTKQYPIGGHAPGDYWHKECVTCKKEFFGDKRAVQCEPCAIEMVSTKVKVNDNGGFEIEKETLEEASESYSIIHGEKYEIKGGLHFINTFNDVKEAFIAGSKWQSEIMFTEEDMKDYSNYVSSHNQSDKWELPLSPKEWSERLKRK
jgi:hypothetical protein